GIFDVVYEPGQAHGMTVTDVVDSEPRVADRLARFLFVQAPCRRRREKAGYAFNDIVDISEVAPHLTMVVKMDRMSFVDGAYELVIRHVRPARRTLNREKPEPNHGEAVK